MHRYLQSGCKLRNPNSTFSNLFYFHLHFELHNYLTANRKSSERTSELMTLYCSSCKARNEFSSVVRIAQLPKKMKVTESKSSESKNKPSGPQQFKLNFQLCLESPNCLRAVKTVQIPSVKAN